MDRLQLNFMAKGQTIKERILSKIAINTDDCWLWTGSRFRKPTGDYSQIRIGNRETGRVRKAHTISYEAFLGPVPKGLELDHLCHNTLCVNPKHLEPVTHSENMKRRKDSGLSHCKHGHKYTKKITYINTRGRRECRICKDISRIKSKNN